MDGLIVDVASCWPSGGSGCWIWNVSVCLTKTVWFNFNAMWGLLFQCIMLDSSILSFWCSHFLVYVAAFGMSGVLHVKLIALWRRLYFHITEGYWRQHRRIPTCILHDWRKGKYWLPLLIWFYLHYRYVHVMGARTSRERLVWVGGGWVHVRVWRGWAGWAEVGCTYGAGEGGLGGVEVGCK